MSESTLAALLAETIGNLDSPDLISGSTWDHPDTLNVSGINEAARTLGIGPVFEIGDAPAWWNWPNLPAEHPNNQVRVERLTVFAADGLAPLDILRFKHELQSGRKTAKAISKAVVSRLKGWGRKASSKARELSQEATSPVVSPCPQCGGERLPEDAYRLCESCRTHRGKVAELEREFYDICQTLNGALFWRHDHHPEWGTNWPHSPAGEKGLAGEFYAAMNIAGQDRVRAARDRILKACGVELGLVWTEPEKWEIAETIRQFIKPFNNPRDRATPIQDILPALYGNLKSQFPAISIPGSVTFLEVSGHIPTHSNEVPQYVTLDQMAVLSNRSKKTLERWLSGGKLPQPDVEGGGGKPHEWLWLSVRESLASHSGKEMPERYPTLRSS